MLREVSPSQRTDTARSHLHGVPGGVSSTEPGIDGFLGPGVRVSWGWHLGRWKRPVDGQRRLCGAVSVPGAPGLHTWEQ